MGGSPLVDDPTRLQALEASGLLSAGFDETLDRWTRLASGLIGAPMAMMTLVDRDRQYFKSYVGLSDELVAARGTALSHSFCQHVVNSGEALVVEDAREHPLVRDNGAVQDHDVIAYAGQPLTTVEGHTLGTLCVIDTQPRAWTARELKLLEDLATGLRTEIDLRGALREAASLREVLEHQAREDTLTGLPNRRALMEDLAAVMHSGARRTMVIFDLDGFKAYNDTFGHSAGDALLVRMAGKLRAALGGDGGAYRLGGDEFCVLLTAGAGDAVVSAATAALTEHGESFSITTSRGQVELAVEAGSAEAALQLADERMYRHKHGRSSSARRQAHDVLQRLMHEREPELEDHAREVAVLAREFGRRLGLDASNLDALVRTAELHDIGKVAIPDQILHKPGVLTPEEWTLIRTHTLLGERILAAAPALAHVGSLVRSSQERWDGQGYPDGLAGAAIPSLSRVVLVCIAFHAMTSPRPYRDAVAAEAAVAELRREAGHQFDPDVVEEFCAHIAVRPVLAG